MENEEKQLPSSECEFIKQPPHDVEAISAGALLCHYRGKDSKVLQAKLQQQVDRTSAEQGSQQEGKTLKWLIWITLGLVLVVAVLDFASASLFVPGVPSEVFYVASTLFPISLVVLFGFLPILAVALIASKRAIAKVIGVIILVLYLAFILWVGQIADPPLD